MSEPGSSFTVLDAGPVIHLDELGCLDLLEGLGHLRLPAQVADEIRKHRPRMRLETIPSLEISRIHAPLAPRLHTLAASLRLQSGELRALALAAELKARFFLTDDAAARLAGESLGLRVHGTVGLVIRSIRRETRTTAQAREIVASIPNRSTLHLSRRLLERVLEQFPR
ncbi:MAG: DNA-binding protein [Chloroflexi bacterium]|nr:DNA-binding protein [Chloroflexota bacterium]